MRKLERSNEQLAFSDIKRLFEERKAALECFCVGSNVKYFWGYSEKEIKDHLAYHLKEAEYDASLALLGAVEAAFRLDFDSCYTKKLKGSRPIALRNYAKEAIARGVVYGYRIPITELCDLLEYEPFLQKHDITSLKIYFNYRHWLAHGRYWQLKLGRSKPTFSEIYEAAKTIKNLLNS